MMIDGPGIPSPIRRLAIFVRLRRVVDLADVIHETCVSVPDDSGPVPESWRNYENRRPLLSEIREPPSTVVRHHAHLEHARHYAPIICLLPVPVPGFHDAGILHTEIDLSAGEITGKEAHERPTTVVGMDRDGQDPRLAAF